MKLKKNLTGPRPPNIDATLDKQQLASLILEHLIQEGLVPELTSQRKPPYYVSIEELQEPEP